MINQQPVTAKELRSRHKESEIIYVGKKKTKDGRTKHTAYLWKNC